MATPASLDYLTGIIDCKALSIECSAVVGTVCEVPITVVNGGIDTAHSIDCILL